MINESQKSKYDAKITEFADKISTAVNVDPRDIEKILRHLGIEDSLFQRDVEEKLVGKYKLPQGSTVGSDRILVEQLRISSGTSPI